jgi:hypothetical protein
MTTALRIVVYIAFAISIGAAALAQGYEQTSMVVRQRKLQVPPLPLRDFCVVARRTADPSATLPRSFCRDPWL